MRQRTHVTCTVVQRNNRFCDDPSADDVPFPICAHHAKQLYRHIREAMAPLASDPLYALWHNVERIQADRERQRVADSAKTFVVYYVQLGEHLKIGYTGSLRKRMRAYPLNRRLLAYEAGGQELELKRHQQFREYLSLGQEYFAPGPKLIEHVNELRAKAGAPAIQAFTA
ncbi:GIY-YIG nuclease family protein [Amycolatopsis sp. NPDC049159]|uniref:GIY-YIG nuclease family protein n=1 Tax=Amycolatopsis sp. NPDC049159 TaxID=3157210 RepID=UPI0033C49825